MLSKYKVPDLQFLADENNAQHVVGQSVIADDIHAKISYNHNQRPCYLAIDIKRFPITLVLFMNSNKAFHKKKQNKAPNLDYSFR